MPCCFSCRHCYAPWRAGFRASGYEWLNLRLGAEFLRDQGVSNLYLDYSLGQYDSVEIIGAGKGVLPQSARTAHHWIMVGASFSLLL